MTDETLARFAAGGLAEVDEQRVRVHLDACSDCREILAACAPEGTAPLGAGRAPVSLVAHPAVGEVLAGKYRIERVIGAGGMGTVVAAVHVDLGTRVAIKTLHPALAADDDAVARFSREAKAAAALTGPHVVRTIDVGRSDSGVP